MSAPIKRRRKMRVMDFVKATEDSEKGLPPTEEMTEVFEAMGKFNEELVNAVVMFDGDGLKPTTDGTRIALQGVSRAVIGGPYAGERELVAGYGVWGAKEMEG